MVQKTFPITKMFWIGAALVIGGMANIAVQNFNASASAWMAPIGGLGLIFLSLIAKKLGRSDA